MKFIRILCQSTLFVATLLIVSCSSKKINENDPASLFEAAQEDVKDSQYTLALERFQKVKNRFPYSKYATEAKLRIGDVYFLQESYIEAAAAYETFRDLHPKHERVAYSLYRTALSYYKDVPGNIARDMTPAQKALDAFVEFLKRFPDSEFKKDSEEKRAEVMNLLAAKEMYIGRFYLKRDLYGSAEPRFQKVLSQYPDSKYAEEAAEKISRIEKIRQNQEQP